MRGRPIVAAETVSVEFETRGGRPFRALRDLTFTVAPGEFVAVIGRSGAGKTSLLRTLTGFVRPKAGSLFVSGVDVPRARAGELHRLRRRVATVPQQYNLVERLSAHQNVLVGRLGFVPTWRSLTGLFPASERLLAYSALKRLGLADKALERVDRLSGGERQRVAIARALVQEPVLVLADEPAASLDVSLTRLVLEELQDLNRHSGVTVIVNLHDIALARAYASRLLALRFGELVFDGDPGDLTDSVSEEVYRGDEPGRPVPDAGDGAREHALEAG